MAAPDYHPEIRSPLAPAIIRQAGVSVEDSPSWLVRLRGSMFIRNVGILSGGSAVGHLFTLAAAPLLSRIYTPADFGGLGLFSSFLTVMSVAVALRYEVSIISGQDEGEAAHLTFASFLFALPMSILAGGLLWLLNRFAALGYGSLPWQAPLLMAF